MVKISTTVVEISRQKNQKMVRIRRKNHQKAAKKYKNVVNMYYLDNGYRFYLLNIRQWLSFSFIKSQKKARTFWRAGTLFDGGL